MKEAKARWIGAYIRMIDPGVRNKSVGKSAKEKNPTVKWHFRSNAYISSQSRTGRDHSVRS